MGTEYYSCYSCGYAAPEHEFNTNWDCIQCGARYCKDCAFDQERIGSRNEDEKFNEQLINTFINLLGLKNTCYDSTIIFDNQCSSVEQLKNCIAQWIEDECFETEDDIEVDLILKQIESMEEAMTEECIVYFIKSKYPQLRIVWIDPTKKYYSCVEEMLTDYPELEKHELVNNVNGFYFEGGCDYGRIGKCENCQDSDQIDGNKIVEEQMSDDVNSSLLFEYISFLENGKSINTIKEEFSTWLKNKD